MVGVFLFFVTGLVPSKHAPTYTYRHFSGEKQPVLPLIFKVFEHRYKEHVL